VGNCRRFRECYYAEREVAFFVFGFGRLLVRISRCEYSADTETDEQKKMNARTKDALDESLILSDKLVPCVPIISCLDPNVFCSG